MTRVIKTSARVKPHTPLSVREGLGERVLLSFILTLRAKPSPKSSPSERTLVLIL